MNTFLQRFGSLILGVLTGLDRLVLRGKLCALYSPEGMNVYLDANKILRKDFEHEKRGLEHVGQLSGKDALPRIVVVFDEFADLMAQRENCRELETSLKRIDAPARAAGIHLALATQRPDKDVVTPLLRANLPTRVCLRVDGERNSKIILDEEGGEKLLGNGDLFWKHGGGMVRLQGTFVAKAELEKLLRLEA
jgi:DNA segregation ATPase FtsK/SpoIIIE, S-DNA-T family